MKSLRVLAHYQWAGRSNLIEIPRNDPSGQIASLTPAMTRQKTEAPLTLPSPR